MVAMPLGPALRKQRQANLSEFKAEPGQHSKFHASQGYTLRPYLKKNSKQPTKKRELTKFP